MAMLSIDESCMYKTIYSRGLQDVDHQEECPRENRETVRISIMSVDALYYMHEIYRHGRLATISDQ